MTKILTHTALATVLWTLCFLQVIAQQMPSDGPYYDFANYMLGKTHSALTDCEKDVQNNTTIDAQWLCGLASVDEAMFKSLWDTHISIRPAGSDTSLNSLSTWGNIILADGSILKGKLYKANDGYLIVSYDVSSSENSAEATIKIGYATQLDYVELPFYIPSEQVVETPSTKASEDTSVETDKNVSDSNGEKADKVSNSGGVNTNWQFQVIDGELSVEPDN